MRIPHNINRNIFNEYQPSRVALNLSLERQRECRSEDASWDELHPARLSELCLRVIAANFERNRIATGLTCYDQILLLEMLPTNLPLPLVLQCIDDGIYWKRMVNDRWKNRVSHVDDHGSNWKRMYMERHVQELVEGFTPEGFDLEFVSEMCELASDYVYKLEIRQLKMTQPALEDDEDEGFAMRPENYDHIDLDPIITGLKNLTELHIQFGMRNLGSNYKKSLFELSEEDCRNIGTGVAIAGKLKVLRIHQSALDDEKLIALLNSMMGNKSLQKIEFSNCLIGDEGAIAVARFLRDRKNVESVNLCNNKICEAGIEALAFVLTEATTAPVRTLNLRFNLFGNDGLRFIASALIRENPKIANLNLSCCDLNEESGILLAEMIGRNGILVEVNLSSNRFGEKAGRAFEYGMERNKTIVHLDLRMTGISDESAINIGKILRLNRIRAKRGEKGVVKELMMIEEREALARRAEEKEREEAQEGAAPEETPLPAPLAVEENPEEPKEDD